MIFSRTSSRYALQAAIHSIWRERNEKRHGAIATPTRELGKLLDRHVRFTDAALFNNWEIKTMLEAYPGGLSLDDFPLSFL